MMCKYKSLISWLPFSLRHNKQTCSDVYKDFSKILPTEIYEVATTAQGMVKTKYSNNKKS
jgi:hypothetical protein